MSLRKDAEMIWRAGLAAVNSASAVRKHVDCDGVSLRIGDFTKSLSEIGRIEVLGAGKAGAGMAAGLESALCPWLGSSRLSGWINVPSDCVTVLERIHLHAARPAGRNEPTPEGVSGTLEILQRIKRLRSDDLCIVLLSGGASALLCCPVSEISLDDKLAVTRALASDGAPIEELNLVRTQLSQVKGGRMAAECTAGNLIALVISDVIGDPLEVIGSGPTVLSPSKADIALKILTDRQLADKIPSRVIRFLQGQARSSEVRPFATGSCFVRNLIVGSNRMALEAAAVKAGELGYDVVSLGDQNAGDAAAAGRDLRRRMQHARALMTNDGPQRLCMLSGGEPTVQLTDPSPDSPSQIIPRSPSAITPKGGRNQELVLAAVADQPNPTAWSGTILLSAGTDGEDGPTDAAGAFADEELVTRVAAARLDPNSFLNHHASYHFFDATGGLLKTGPTHTNVMDLRVALVHRKAE